MHHRSAILVCRTRVNVQKVWNIEIPSMPSPRLSKTRATSPSRNNSDFSNNLGQDVRIVYFAKTSL